MKKELSQLAKIASEFEHEGNLEAGKLITLAMKKIAQGWNPPAQAESLIGNNESPSLPVQSKQTLRQRGKDPGEARNIEQAIYQMVMKARAGDERMSQILRRAVKEGTGFESESEWMDPGTTATEWLQGSPLTSTNDQGYVSPSNPMNPALYNLQQ
ncbi:MAG: hypothetical protein UT24_C0018G0014 [Candidatus Woesebacteria bacterium GW2011_GWB1_39_12]|uniref:Uncharacterized protein n=1 Tax=Candidatus Woesebacteria bacterium GW2011_GWB1_39_12 TaxID=1618574 RepID=A0A0G0QE78_9BACT|nr:MAG: hypothetical protein UT24_C0018G0014 [Candidatus Woesebacteria bacterium GW2011_GWB1_39_12]